MLEMIQRYGFSDDFDARSRRRESSTETGRLAVSSRELLRDLFLKLVARVESVGEDRNLSEEGAAERKAALRREFFESHAELIGKIERAAARAENFDAKMRTELAAWPESRTPAQTLRDLAVLEHLRRKVESSDPASVFLELLSRIDGGDAETVLIALTAPHALGFLETEHSQELVSMLRPRLWPAEYAEFSDLDEVGPAMRLSLDRLKVAAEELAPLTQEESDRALTERAA